MLFTLKWNERPPLALAMVQSWLSSCDGLATELDRIVYDTLTAMLGVAPW